MANMKEKREAFWIAIHAMQHARTRFTLACVNVAQKHSDVEDGLVSTGEHSPGASDYQRTTDAALQAAVDAAFMASKEYKDAETLFHMVRRDMNEEGAARRAQTAAKRALRLAEVTST